MKVAFRTDASMQMGSGHVMRCLTLADALKAQGAQCQFISRQHPGHLLEAIHQRGYKVNSMAAPVQQAQAAIKNDNTQPNETTQTLAHAAWLGCDWQTDAAQTADILATLQPDWLVVDHYALDQRWESALQRHYKRLMVVDDLADRPHNCDLLLDQNLGRQRQDYASLVPATCQVFTGPRYALLRPEFAALRDYSLKRRANAQHKQIKQVLITMGGVDLTNATGQVLEALKACPLPADCRITVVMGATAPGLAQVQELAQQMPWPTSVLVNITDMAQHMANSDLAIGAAGSTSWERCCLGLPTLMFVLADNQKVAAAHLEQAGVANCLTLDGQLQRQIQERLQYFLNQSDQLGQMSILSSEITDGNGAQRIVSIMENFPNICN
jgi:UDP-2,4-diacetamido-2,4,6-trideoxy-beta-L-altropyranose hydrolase